MRLVVIESPYAGDVELNTRYLRAAMRDSLDRGEAPFAAHGLYTQPGVLDDTDAAERAFGIRAGLAWGWTADLIAVYMDLGMSEGMEQALEQHRRRKKNIEQRWIPGWFG